MLCYAEEKIVQRKQDKSPQNKNMAVEKRRTLTYRSFVTCEDPKGVVDCGAIKKSKLIISHKKMQTNQNPMKEKKEIRGVTREFPKAGEVLKNHVTNNNSDYIYSKKHHQKEIAIDLLQGTLHLQKSLIMLRRLQEVSGYDTDTPRKTPKEGGFDGMVKGLMDSNSHLPPQFSVDGSSKKSSYEMRNVVRESLLRQNVITNPIFEKHVDHRNKFISCYDDMLPSMSSSDQSSMMIHPCNFAPSECSMSSTSSTTKDGKGSNLIVRLMGLESPPSRIMNLPKPTMYVIDSPKATKQKTVDEILETLNFKGLLRSNNDVKGMMTTHDQDSLCYGQILCMEKGEWIDERPPIVLMKPVTPKCRGNSPTAKMEDKLLKSRSKTANSIEKTRIKVEGADKILNSLRKVVSSSASSSSKVKASVNQQHEKVRTNQATVKRVSEVVKTTPRRKGEEKKVVKSSDELPYRDQTKLSRTSKAKKQKEGTLISKKHGLIQQKNTSTAILEHRTCEASLSPSHQTKARQPVLTVQRQIHRYENEESVGTNKEEEPVEASQIQITDYHDQISVSDGGETFAYLQNGMKFPELIKTHEVESKSSGSDITSCSTTELTHVGHLKENHHCPIPEVTLLTTHENGVPVHLKSVRERIENHPEYDQHVLPNIASQHETSRNCIPSRTNLKALLLRSPLFMNHAEELFDLKVNLSGIPDIDEQTPADSNVDIIISNKLFIDCADEILRIRAQSFQLSQPCLPLRLRSLYANKCARKSLSIDELLEEVYKGFKELRSYMKPEDEDDNFCSDSTFVLLEKDLKVKKGTWEIGWMNMFSPDEVDKVIGDIDKLILGKLIEEVVVDIRLL